MLLSIPGFLQQHKRQHLTCGTFAWCAEHMGSIYPWGIPDRGRSRQLCGGRDPDYRVGESKSLAPKTGLCGLIMVDDTSRSKIMQSGTEKLAIAPSIRGADAT